MRLFWTAVLLLGLSASATRGQDQNTQLPLTVDVATTSTIRLNRDLVQYSGYYFDVTFYENGELKDLTGLLAKIQAKKVEDVYPPVDTFLFQDDGTVYPGESRAEFPVQPGYLGTNSVGNVRFELQLLTGNSVDVRVQLDSYVIPGVATGNEQEYVPPDPQDNYYDKGEIDAMLTYMAETNISETWDDLTTVSLYDMAVRTVAGRTGAPPIFSDGITVSNNSILGWDVYLSNLQGTNTFTVDSESYFNGPVTMNNQLTIDSEATVESNMIINGTLDVTGAYIKGGLVNTDTISVTTPAAAMTATDPMVVPLATAGSVTVSDPLILDSTLQHNAYNGTGAWVTADNFTSNAWRSGPVAEGPTSFQFLGSRPASFNQILVGINPVATNTNYKINFYQTNTSGTTNRDLEIGRTTPIDYFRVSPRNMAIAIGYNDPVRDPTGLPSGTVMLTSDLYSEKASYFDGAVTFNGGISGNLGDVTVDSITGAGDPLTLSGPGDIVLGAPVVANDTVTVSGIATFNTALLVPTSRLDANEVYWRPSASVAGDYLRYYYDEGTKDFRVRQYGSTATSLSYFSGTVAVSTIEEISFWNGGVSDVPTRLKVGHRGPSGSTYHNLVIGDSVQRDYMRVYASTGPLVLGDHPATVVDRNANDIIIGSKTTVDNDLTVVGTSTFSGNLNASLTSTFNGPAVFNSTVSDLAFAAGDSVIDGTGGNITIQTDQAANEFFNVRARSARFYGRGVENYLEIWGDGTGNGYFTTNAGSPDPGAFMYFFPSSFGDRGIRLISWNANVGDTRSGLEGVRYRWHLPRADGTSTTGLQLGADTSEDWLRLTSLNSATPILFGSGTLSGTVVTDGQDVGFTKDVQIEGDLEVMGDIITNAGSTDAKITYSYTPGGLATDEVLVQFGTTVLTGGSITVPLGIAYKDTNYVVMATYEGTVTTNWDAIAYNIVDADHVTFAGETGETITYQTTGFITP